MEPLKTEPRPNLTETNTLTSPPRPPRRPITGLKAFLIAGIFVVAAFAGGFALGQKKIAIENGKIEITRGPARSADYNLLWDALDLLNSKYVDRENLDQKKLLYGAIRGMFEASGDPYTVFFDPTESKQFADELKGSFEGIGAEIGTKDDQIVIIAPLDGTPAQRAGLIAGDVILGINGESTSGLTVDQAVSKIRGKAGTEVVLFVVHPGQTQPQEIKIIRENISIKSAEMETREINGKKIAVIKLSRFGDDTKGLFDHMVDVVLSGNYQGLVLDMRNNPGGYLDTSVDLAANWVQNGDVVVKEVDYQNHVKEYKASGLARLRNMKTMVLVNGGSASASEILAGALQDYKLATLVGQKTFGKGSVQQLEDLADETTVKITIAKWHTPKDRSIDKNGLEPDVKVEPNTTDSEADPQMDRALDLLK